MDSSARAFVCVRECESSNARACDLQLYQQLRRRAVLRSTNGSQTEEDRSPHGRFCADVLFPRRRFRRGFGAVRSGGSSLFYTAIGYSSSHSSIECCGHGRGRAVSGFGFMGEYGRRARGEDFGGGGDKARLQNRQSALRQVGRERAPLRRQRRACARNERRARANLTGESGRWGAPLSSSPVEQHAAAPAAKLPAGCGKVCTPFGTAGGWEGNARYFHTSLACSGLTPASESASASRRRGVVCAGIGVRSVQGGT